MSNKILYRYSRYIKFVFLFWDIVLLNSAYIFSFYLREGSLNKIASQQAQSIFLITNLIWFLLVFYNGEYKFMRIEHIDKTLSKSMKIILLHILLTFTVIFALKFEAISRLRMVYFYTVFFSEVFFFRILFLRLLKYLRKKGYNFRRVVIVGAGQEGQEICSVLLKDMAYGYRVLGYFDDQAISTGTVPVLGKISEIQNFVANNSIHEIYVANPGHDENQIKALTAFCENNMIRIKFIPDFKKFTDSKKVFIDFYENIPVISLRKEPLEIPFNRIVKRIFDTTFSLVMILLIFPWLFPILILLVKLSSKGPVFFKQQRSGENNKTFYCWKFRTMKVNSLSDELQATKNDLRITGIGRFLRKTNLDELPQFFNVLIGDMSVVGPRPHMLKHTEEYSALINNYLVRHYTRPGITGMSQVTGLRGETKELVKMEERVSTDIWYIENWSFMLDLKIILNTSLSMFRKNENAF